MAKNSELQRKPSNPESLARHFSRWGWTGFWMQLGLLLIPIVLLAYVLFIGGEDSAQRRGINLSNYLSFLKIKCGLIKPITIGNKMRAASMLITKRDPNAAPNLAWSLMLENSQENTPAPIIMPVKNTAFPEVARAL